MAGIQEILTLIVLVFGILFLPRILKGRSSSGKPSPTKPELSGILRLGILLSIVFPVAMALFLQPWKHNLILFITIGILPVVLGWGIFWVRAGFKKQT